MTAVGRMIGVATLLLLAMATWVAVWATDKQAKFVPEYQAGYSTDQQLQVEIRDEIRGLRSDLAALFRVVVEKGTVKADGALVAKTRCAGCHAEGLSKTGGDFAFLRVDGTPRPWSVPERRAMRAKVESGAMPPDSVLPVGEKRALLEFLKGDKP